MLPPFTNLAFLAAMSLSPQARTPAALHQSIVKIIAAARIITLLVVSDRMSLPEPFELVVEVAEAVLAVLADCCDCVNGTGDAVIEFVLELTNMLLLLLLTTIDEELCITCVDCELLSDVPVSYPTKYVRLGASVQKNDTAPSSV
jgi:hypothetical protein